MNGQSLNLFGFPITKFVIEDWSDKKSKLLNLIDFTGDDIQEFDYFESDYECQTDYYKYQTSAPYLMEFHQILETDLDKLVSDYTQILSDRYRGDCPFKGIEDWQLWSQRYDIGQFHGAHNHGLMNISCVLYVEFDAKEHFPTTFYSPNPNPFYGTIDKIAPPVNEGEILTFPSVLLHESPVSKSNKQRTIMSFNIPMR